MTWGENEWPEMVQKRKKNAKEEWMRHQMREERMKEKGREEVSGDAKTRSTGELLQVQNSNEKKDENRREAEVEEEDK